MTAPALPLDLPRLVMRRAAGVGALALLLAAAVGLSGTSRDIEGEVDAAMALAGLTAQLSGLDGLDTATALKRVREAAAAEHLRHLSLHLHDADGQPLLAPEPAPPPPQPLAAAMALHRRWLSTPEQRSVAWQLPRPDGRAWTVTLSASAEAERREALGNLLITLALLTGGLLALLTAMTGQVRQALQPLSGLVQAIGDIDRRGTASVRTLPHQPLRELETIAAALRSLGTALDETEDRRRLLARQLMSVQEDERLHLARELHDEFGQRLTALRLDAAWLVRRLQTDDLVAAAPLRDVAQGMAARCSEVQDDIRGLLSRLRPLGGSDPTEPLAWSALDRALHDLVGSWRGRPALAGHVEWHCEIVRQPPGPVPEAPLTLGADLAQAIYRLSQEALTNVARHASGAREVRLRLEHTPAGPGPATLQWQVEDDGCGLDRPETARQRGVGLGGMQERVWALGGTWTLAPARPDGTGLRLSAHWLLAPPTPSDPDPATGTHAARSDD